MLLCVAQSGRLAAQNPDDLLNFTIRDMGQSGPPNTHQVPGWCGLCVRIKRLFLDFYFVENIVCVESGADLVKSDRELGQQGRNASAELSCSWQERLSRTPVVSALTSPCCHVAATHHPPLLENISETNPGQVTAIAMK